MARFVWYQCPDCGGTFRFLHHPSDSDPPDRCELCLAWMAEDAPPIEAFVPQAPLIRKSDYAKSVDQTYRAMEESSAQRANEAAGMLEDQYRADNRASPHEGDPALLYDFQRDQVAKMKSELKITDMRDPSEMRPGDTSITSAHSGAAAAAAARLSVGPNRPQFQNLSGGVPNMAPGIGPAAHQAHSALTGHSGWQDGTPAVANTQHQSRAAALVRAGEIGRDSG
jgi:hypothetical protein